MNPGSLCIYTASQLLLLCLGGFGGGGGAPPLPLSHRSVAGKHSDGLASSQTALRGREQSPRFTGCRLRSLLRHTFLTMCASVSR